MTRDSEGLTGEKIMADENFKRAALICTEEEDVLKAMDVLRYMMDNGSNSEKLQAAKIVLDFNKPKPPIRKDITTAGERITAGIFIEELDDDKEI